MSASAPAISAAEEKKFCTVTAIWLKRLMLR